VHYLAQQVEDYLGSQDKFAQWATVFQDKPRGTGDALRQCRHLLQSDCFLVLNGDDLFGARGLQALAEQSAGVLVHTVDEPRKFGIVFLKPDGTLDKLIEKPALEGRQLANTGAYVFPREVFDIEIQLSARGEYEITDYVSALARRRPFHVVQADFWLPIGTEEAWKNAEQQNLDGVMTGR
jgi:dTDP-glucose pyrophosphorylase